MSPSIGPPMMTPPGASYKPEAVEAPQPGDDAIAPNPAAVGYRTEAETCGNCTYFASDFCSHPIVAQAVAAGDSCAAFESGTGEAGGMEMAETIPEEAEAE